MSSILPLPKFIELNELCSKSAGGEVLFATDDYFAPAENMILDNEPVFIQEKFTEFGKWMDGWETRRKRCIGHDWCIIKLGSKAIIHGVDVDTAFFTGNFTPKYSIQAACLTPEDEKLIPLRKGEMGSCCNRNDLIEIGQLSSEHWQEIIPKTALQPGYEDTRHNYQKVISDEAFTHIRINMYPDGGIARLRVYGIAKLDMSQAFIENDMVDLIAMKNGGVCQGYSNAHYGHPRNLIKQTKGYNMADGWETARRLDRPDVIQANEDGTLKVPGCEWATFKLGYSGSISRICVDTHHFKGNFPDSVKIEGALINNCQWSETIDKSIKWINILPTTKLSAHAEHWYDCNVEDKISHVRVTIAPDGGISRVRLFSNDLF
ncbi:allantoicase-like [Arctopsyche grandis]|uniref:allantoicase-like n=1 Tax=Arctopsyche grandis TaxID=121162 RepID=UPI00406D8FAC